MQAAATAGQRGSIIAPQAANLVKVLRMGAVVVVQDALELVERFPNNPIHKLLTVQQSFRWDSCSAFHQ